MRSLQEALASGTTEEVPGLSHRFSHELVRRALYDRLAAVRRAELHLRVGEALERVHGVDDDRTLPELAHHFAIAAPLGVAERAVDCNLRAGQAAVWLFAYAQAESFAATALEFASQGGASWARAQYLLATAKLHLAHGGSEVQAAAAAAEFAALGDVEAASDAEIICAPLTAERRPTAPSRADNQWLRVLGTGFGRC